MAKKKVKNESLSMDKHIKYSMNHANLYYIMMTISLVLAIFFLVQGIRYHVTDFDVQWPLTHYTMFVLLMIIAKSSHKRGKGHYHYHAHIKD